MKLLENVHGTKGITLNAQLVKVLSILDEDIPKEEQDRKIMEYIKVLKEANEKYGDISGGKKHKTFVEDVINHVDGISEEERKSLIEIYMNSLNDLSVCDKSKMQEKLKENGLDPNLHTKLAETTIETYAKEGMLDFTPGKARKLYDHMFKNGNKYDRVTFDNVGKYSGYVAFDGETYTPGGMDEMMEFCEKHDMEAKVNTLMFYADFPKTLEKSLLIKAENGEIEQKQVKEELKQSLINYAKDIGERYGDRIDTVDIFNELIYDPVMKEPGFDEDESFHQREEGWQKYLNLEDLCEMALEARKRMPDVTFTYNDMNWVNPEKRKEIIKVIKEIQAIEERYRKEGKLGPDEKGLIDTIGVEAHLTNDVDLEQINKVFDDIKNEIGLPVEITEFDVARTGENPLSKIEIKKQNKVFAEFAKILQERPEIISFTIWSQSDEMSFMNDKMGRTAYASLLDADFNEKDFELIFSPQSFNYHTHTSLCGHANEEQTMRDYVEAAIESGMTSLGFSDHTPSPFDKESAENVMTVGRSHMNMRGFDKKYIPELEELKEEYKDKIDIKIGLEAEYFGEEGEKHPAVKAFREKTEPKLDYMILGQHTALARDDNGKIIMKPAPRGSDPKSSRYPLDYAMTVVEAIRSGKFAYVAHPDIFLENRDNVYENEKEDYMENAKNAIEMICEEAVKYDIPLEVNLGSITAIEAGEKGKTLLKDGSYPYPVPAFWKVAAEKGCKVLIGTDAHDKNSLIDKTAERKAVDLLENKGIELNYLESFTPRGIGKEGKLAENQEQKSDEEVIFSSQEVGKAFIERTVEGKVTADEKVKSEQRAVLNEKETKKGQEL